MLAIISSSAYLLQAERNRSSLPTKVQDKVINPTIFLKKKRKKKNPTVLKFTRSYLHSSYEAMRAQFH